MNTSETTQKLGYVAPKLTVVGSLEEITQRTGNGGHLDASYPAGYPRGDIFS